MKSFFETVLRWLSSSRRRGDEADDAHVSAVPENERRLRELEERGRKLFLP